MISHAVITRSSAGKGTIGAIDSYYQDSKDDYYSKESQPSQWQGKLADELQLNGGVKKEDFINLLAGKNPANKEQLRPDQFNRKEANIRLGIDLTFSAPKSVSIESLVNGKKEVLDAHELAVTKTLELIEQKSQTRKKVSGISTVEDTGKIAVAKFRHETNRNLDPQLHTHAVIVNLTKRKDGQYRALHNDQIIKNTKEFTKIYQGFLAKELKNQGYNLRITKNGFELAHINEKQIEVFSSRSKEIENHLKKSGLSRNTATAEQKQEASLKTRNAKDEKDIIQVRNAWKVKANDQNILPFKNEVNTAVSHKDLIVTSKSLDAFDYPLNTNFDEKANLFETEYLLNDYKIEFKNQIKREESGRSDSDTRGLGNNRNTGIGGNTAGRSDSDTRGLGNNRNTGIRGNTKAEELKEQQKGVSADATSNREIRQSNHDGGYRNNPALSSNGLEQKGNFATVDSQQNQQQDYSKRTIGFSDSVRAMPSVNMANLTQSNHVLLPSREKIQFFNGRTEYAIGLRGNQSSDRGNESGIEENESLDDIVTKESIDEALKQSWMTKFNDLKDDHTNFDEIDLSDLDQDELYVSNIAELKEFAIDHLTDKDHIFSHDKIKSILIEKGLGIVDYDDVENVINEMVAENQIIKTDAEYKHNGVLYTKEQIIQHLGINHKMLENAVRKNDIEKVPTVYTTKEAIQLDQTIINRLNTSQHKYEKSYQNNQADFELDKTTLNQEQRACAKMVLTSDNAILGIQGYAGTGKSYMVSKTKEILEKAGKELHIFAPYASQVKNLRADGLEANTVASFLLSKKMQEKLNKDSIIVIDEAGVINTKQMVKILNLREKIGCQIVLLGDTAQTKAVEAGTPFELLQKKGMETSVMKDIQRQKDQQLRESVIQGVQGNYEKSVELLKNLYEVKDKSERHQGIVNQYLSFNDGEREKTLIVAGTNDDRRNINELIREKLGTKGNGVMTEKLQQIDKTKAESALAINYNKGEYIVIGKPNKSDGLEKNTPYLVVGRNPSENTIQVLDDGKIIDLKLTKTKQVASYNLEKIEMSVGDKIRVTRTDKDKGLSTGDLFEVKSISQDTKQAYAEDKEGKGYTFNLDEKHHIDHSYAMTIHASQGLTYENVICDFNTNSQTLGMETYYVGVSRAKEKALVFTDNVQNFPEKIAQSATKHNASELFENTKDNEININLNKEKPMKNADIVQIDSSEKMDKYLLDEQKDIVKEIQENHSEKTIEFDRKTQEVFINDAEKNPNNEIIVDAYGGITKDNQYYTEDEAVKVVKQSQENKEILCKVEIFKIHKNATTSSSKEDNLAIALDSINKNDFETSFKITTGKDSYKKIIAKGGNLTLDKNQFSKNELSLIKSIAQEKELNIIHQEQKQHSKTNENQKESDRGMEM